MENLVNKLSIPDISKIVNLFSAKASTMTFDQNKLTTHGMVSIFRNEASMETIEVEIGNGFFSFTLFDENHQEVFLNNEELIENFLRSLPTIQQHPSTLFNEKSAGFSSTMMKCLVCGSIFPLYGRFIIGHTGSIQGSELCKDCGTTINFSISGSCGTQTDK